MRLYVCLAFGLALILSVTAETATLNAETAAVSAGVEKKEKQVESAVETALVPEATLKTTDADHEQTVKLSGSSNPLFSQYAQDLKVREEFEQQRLALMLDNKESAEQSQLVTLLDKEQRYQLMIVERELQLRFENQREEVNTALNNVQYMMKADIESLLMKKFNADRQKTMDMLAESQKNFRNAAFANLNKLQSVDKKQFAKANKALSGVSEQDKEQTQEVV